MQLNVLYQNCEHGQEDYFDFQLYFFLGHEFNLYMIKKTEFNKIPKPFLHKFRAIARVVLYTVVKILWRIPNHCPTIANFVNGYLIGQTKAGCQVNR